MSDFPAPCDVLSHLQISDIIQYNTGEFVACNHRMLKLYRAFHIMLLMMLHRMLTSIYFLVVSLVGMRLFHKIYIIFVS